MANIVVSTGQQFVIDAANTYYLSGGTDRAVSTYALHLVSDEFSGSVTVQSRSQTASAQSDAIAPVPVPYLSTYVNGAVGDGTYVTTALTDTSLILVPASGQQIVLDCSSYTSGTLTVYAMPLLGAGA